MHQIGASNLDLMKVQVASKALLKKMTRYGIEIQAYLTIPKEVEGQQLPAVISPHIFMSARDPNSIYWNAFLTNRSIRWPELKCCPVPTGPESVAAPQYRYTPPAK